MIHIIGLRLGQTPNQHKISRKYMETCYTYLSYLTKRGKTEIFPKQRSTCLEWYFCGRYTKNYSLDSVVVGTVCD